MSTRAYMRNYEASQQVKSEMAKIGVDTGGLDIMVPKGRSFTFILKGVDARAANIIKQEFLSKGGEAALAYHCLTDLGKCSDMILMATESQYRKILAKFKKQPFGLSDLAGELETMLNNLDSPRNFEIQCAPSPIKLGGQTRIISILNVTPDSFSDGGQFSDVGEAVAHGVRMAETGADIIDVGGESTRPGSAPVSAEEEIERVVPVIKELRSKINIPISIDTSKPEVARAALEAGASIINDVTGLADDNMARLAAEKGVPVIIMHMQGNPRTMQDEPDYDDVVDDIIDYFRERIAIAEEHGMARPSIIIDPGIGFGKTLEHNLEIIRRLAEFKILGLPIMVGPSRKSFIGKIQGANADGRLEGSLAAAVVSAMKGADIVRVHDVKETRLALQIADAISDTK